MYDTTIWAARHGDEEVVRLLLRKKNNIQPDQQDVKFDQTVHSWTARGGHEEVVKLFLGPRFVGHRVKYLCFTL